MRIQACFNVPQTFASRNLGVRQTKKLIERGKGFGPMLPSISMNAEIKVMPGESIIGDQAPGTWAYCCLPAT